jgi:hypothetical protein
MSRVGSHCLRLPHIFPFLSRQSRSQEETTVDHAAIRGWAPPFLASVGGLPHARAKRTWRPRHAAEGDPTPGLRLFRETLQPWRALEVSLGLRWPGALLGHGPHEGAPFPGNGDHDLLGIFAFGHELALACAEPDLGLPADGLHRCGELLQAQWQVPTDVGRIPGSPGPFDASTTRMRIAGLGHAVLLATWPTGIFGRRQPQIAHKLSGMIEARQVAQCGHHGHCDGALDTPQSLEGLDPGREAPGFDLLVEFEFKTSQAFRLFRDGLDVSLKDNLLCRGGTAHLAEPAQGGRAPGGPPGRADIVPQQEGFEPSLGRLQIAEGIFPRPTQGAKRVSVDGRHIHRGEVPGAHEPGQWHSITPVSFDPVPRLFGNQSGGDDPADVALFHQVAIEPIAAGTGFVDEDECRAFRPQLPKQLIDITLPGSNGAEGDNRGTLCLGDRGDGDGLFMDIHANGERARL